MIHREKRGIMRRISSAERSALVRLAETTPKGSPERKQLLAAIQKAGGYDKSVWASVPRQVQGVILEHLGSPRQPGVSDPIPYFTGFARSHFVATKALPATPKGEFVLGRDGSEPVVQWTHQGTVSYFLAPAPG